MTTFGTQQHTGHIEDSEQYNCAVSSLCSCAVQHMHWCKNTRLAALHNTSV